MTKYSLILCLLLAGCSVHKRTVLFYKVNDSEYYNLMGERCIQSGIVIDDEHLTLRESYINCDFFIERKLKERELKLWGLPKNKYKGIKQ